MKISKDSIDQIDFEGLQIVDYTSGRDTTSSLAEITVPPGVKHRKAYSNRSDKYYYKGQKFSYKNDSGEPAKLILLHTPSFNLELEVFEE